MLILKPMTLGVLQKPYRYRRQHHWVVVALGFFRLGADTPRFLPEQDGWSAALTALPADEPLDAVMPKACGEVLLGASAYAPRGVPLTEMPVRVCVGTIDKRLRIVGARRHRSLAISDTSTAPVPFTEMPLTWARAYGGPRYGGNPAGCADLGERRAQLPNIEYADAAKRYRYTPAGVGPLDIRWPIRQASAGTYDDEWLAHDFPGLARDTDFALFNAAPFDQRIDGYFNGGEPYRLEGLHQTIPVIEGTLPRMRVRAFMQRTGQAACTEVPTVLDTVWFFPGEQLGVSVYRGQAIIEDSEALDVIGMMLAYEHAAERPRSLDHYQEAFRLRADPKTAAFHILNEAPLTPSPSAQERSERDAKRVAAAAAEAASAQAQLDEAVADFWAQSGMTPPADFVAPEAEPSPFASMTPEAIANGEVDLAQVVATAEAMALDARARADAEVKRLPPTPAPPAVEIGAQIRAAEARASVIAHDLIGDAAAQAAAAGLSMLPPLPAGLDDATRAKILDNVKQLPSLQRRARRTSPTAMVPAEPLAPEAALHVGRKVRAWLADGVCLAGRDFAGAKLSGINFSGADLREAMFERADLRDVDFRGADLSGAVLTEADLTSADFTGANLCDTNLSHALAAGAVFRDARLDRAQATAFSAAGADFSGASLRSLIGMQIVLTDAILDGANLSDALLQDAVAYGARFVEARLERTVLLDARVQAADFSGATLERCALVNACADRSIWRGSRLTRVQTTNTSFTGADLRDVRAQFCGFRNAVLACADLEAGRFVNCDFGKADFSGARLVGTVLARSILSQAVLRDCATGDTDLFQALCRKTDFGATAMDGMRRVQADLTEARFSAVAEAS